MKKSILLTCLLSLMLSTLSFAQETPTPEKERNWIVGVGLGYGSSDNTGWNLNPVITYSATLGYKGFTASYYRMPEINSNLMLNYATVGYQHVFSKKSNAEVKPIIGVEYGVYAAVLNTGVRYKRHQFLISLSRYIDYERYDFPTFIPSFIPSYSTNYTRIKYQFLF